MFHIVLPYKAPENSVFIKQEFEGSDWFTSIHLSELKLEDEVILCNECNRIAVELDHYYPYYSSFNKCIIHKNEKAE